MYDFPRNSSAKLNASVWILRSSISSINNVFTLALQHLNMLHQPHSLRGLQSGLLKWFAISHLTRYPSSFAQEWCQKIVAYSSDGATEEDREEDLRAV